METLSDNAMIQKARDYLTKRHVELVDQYDDLTDYFNVTVYHDPDFKFWHQVRFVDKADKTLGWIVEVVWLECERQWKLAARCLPYALG